MKSPSASNLSNADRMRNSVLGQAGAQVFKLLVLISIGGWSARYLGPEKLGILAYVAGLVGMLAPLGSLGVKGSLSSILCDDEPLPGLLESAFVIELVGTFVIAAPLSLVAWSTKSPLISILIGMAVIGNLLSSTEVIEAVILNDRRGTILARIGVIETSSYAVVSIISLLSQAPLLIFGSLPVIQSAVRAFLLIISLQSKNCLFFLRQVSVPTIQALIRRGWPLLLAGLSVTIYMKSDIIMIEWLLGPAEVGQYSVAVKVAESLYFLPIILSNTFLPKIGIRSQTLESNQALRLLYKSSWLLGVGMMLISMFVLPYFIPAVFGVEFVPAKDALIWLGPASFAVALGCASGTWLNTQGHQSLIAIRSVFGAFLNVGLNFLFIPKMGIAGAALSTSIAYIVSVFSISVFNKKARENHKLLILPLYN